jgi:hypothetical protein
MKVATEILDSWTESALQDLLIDVAAVVAATETDRDGYRSDPDCTYVAARWNLRPGA